MGVGGQLHAPASLIRKRPATRCIGSWVGPRAGLDGCGKSRPPPPLGFDPQTVQPVPSRYTLRAIPARTVRCTHRFLAKSAMILILLCPRLTQSPHFNSIRNVWFTYHFMYILKHTFRYMEGYWCTFVCRCKNFILFSQHVSIISWWGIYSDKTKRFCKEGCE
jgi:hypothetical protein